MDGYCLNTPTAFVSRRSDRRLIFELPLARLLADDAVERERWRLRGRPYLVPFFRHGEHRIWGATARMLAQLAAALRAVTSEAP